MNMSLKKLTSIPAVLFMLMIAIGVQARCQTVSEPSDVEVAANQPIDPIAAACSKGEQKASFISLFKRYDGVDHCNSTSGAAMTAWFEIFPPTLNPQANQLFRDVVGICKRYKGVPVTNVSSKFYIIQCSYPHVE
jgi:hypothetical protein